MNRHQKELRLAELKVSRDILNKQIEAIQRELATEGLEIWEAIQRELATEGLEIWKDRQNVYMPSDVCPACGRLTEYRGLIKVGAVTAPCSHPCHGPDTPQA